MVQIAASGAVAGLGKVLTRLARGRTMSFVAGVALPPRKNGGL
jgi:hypothetical protein